VLKKTIKLPYQTANFAVRLPRVAEASAETQPESALKQTLAQDLQQNFHK